MPHAAFAVIAKAIIAIGVKAGIAKAVAMFAVKALTALALNAAVSAVANAFVSKPSSGFSLLDPAQFNNISSDPLAPRIICYGESAIAGEIVFEDLHTDRKWVSYVIQLADFGQDQNPHELIRLEVDGSTVNFDGSGNATGTFAGVMKRRFYGGDPDQTADSALVSSSSGLWTTDHRGRGCVYVVWECKLSDTEKFPSGLPTGMWVLRGRRLYNPLKDSTFPGGAGSHRLDDETTWEYDNLAPLVASDYARGISMNGIRCAGLHVPADLIDQDQLAASISAAEVEGWTINGFVLCDADPGEVLKSFAQHMGGRIASRKGRLAIVAGYDWPDVLTLGEDDLAGPLQLDTARPWRDAYNAVRGTYREPANDWGPIETNLIQIADWVTEDGEVLERPFAAPYSHDFVQTSKLAKIELYRERQPCTIDGAWKLRAAEAGEAQTVRVRLPQYEIDARFEIVNRALDAMGFVSFSLRQWDPELGLAFAEEDAGDMVTADALNRSSLTPTTPSGFTATGTAISSATGALPAILVQGTPLDWVDGVVVEISEDAGSTWNVVSDTRPEGS